MKAQNNRDIKKSMGIFALYFVTLVMLSVTCVNLFLVTSKVEINKVVAKTYEYDMIQIRQVELAESMDNLYNMLLQVNSNKTSNHMQLMNLISNRKEEFSKSMVNTSSRDYLFYQKLSAEFNTFLMVKDSIRMLSVEKQLIRNDLMQCISDNREITRKQTTGGLTYQR